MLIPNCCNLEVAITAVLTIFIVFFQVVLMEVLIIDTRIMLQCIQLVLALLKLVLYVINKKNSSGTTVTTVSTT